MALVAFVVFGFVSQLALLAFFATFLLRRSVGTVIGRVVYALGAAAVPIAIWLALEGRPWYLAAALLLYAAWAAFGAWIDVFRPIEWREPADLRVVIPYAAVLMAALLGLWIPLWAIDRSLWIAFGSLYAAHTTLNVLAHIGARRRTQTAPGEPA